MEPRRVPSVHNVMSAGVDTMPVLLKHNVESFQVQFPWHCLAADVLVLWVLQSSHPLFCTAGVPVGDGQPQSQLPEP